MHEKLLLVMWQSDARHPNTVIMNSKQAFMHKSSLHLVRKTCGQDRIFSESLLAYMWLFYDLNLHLCCHSQAWCSTDKWTHASLKSESRSIILQQLKLSYDPETKDLLLFKSEWNLKRKSHSCWKMKACECYDLLMHFCACVSSVEMHLWTPDRPVSVSHTCHRNRVSTTSCPHVNTTKAETITWIAGSEMNISVKVKYLPPAIDFYIPTGNLSLLSLIGYI